jgi:penicillin-binding protein 1C
VATAVEERVRVAFPTDGARFVIDPGAAARQELRLRADVPAGVKEVRFVIDGRTQVVRAPFAVRWPLAPGEHRMRVEADGAGADEVTFEVE